MLKMKFLFGDTFFSIIFVTAKQDILIGLQWEKWLFYLQKKILKAFYVYLTQKIFRCIWEYLFLRLLIL